MYMEPWKMDVSVLLIFFNRPEQLKQVFEQIRIAKPKRLFLYQDGPRNGNHMDILRINECRNIVERIDWDCKVFRYFQAKNIGYNPSEYIAQKWTFSIADKCIILEDDDVPSQSFFRFCKELLDKYEFDERINMISGMNHLSKVDRKDSYIFATTCATSGWASWKRVIDQWDSEYLFLNDKEIMKKLKDKMNHNNIIHIIIDTSSENKESGKAHYESILATSMFLNNRLNIIPSVNLISNIGITSETTLGKDSLDKLPKGIRRIFFRPTFEMHFPLKHPKYMIEDIDYQRRLIKIMGWNSPLIKASRMMKLLRIKLKNKSLKPTLHDEARLLNRRLRISKSD